MEKTLYEVIHEYDIDGEFGDAVATSDSIAIFESKQDAEEFVKKFSNPHIYNKPYDELWCGSLEIKERKLFPKGVDINSIQLFGWWLEEE